MSDKPIFSEGRFGPIENLHVYKNFRKVQQAVNERAREFADLFQSLDSRLEHNRFYDVETFTDSINVNWYWTGAYGATEEGSLNVPTEFLFAPKETWRDYIIARVAHEKQQELEKEEAQKEKEKQKRIADAKAVLEREGAS